MLPLPPVRPADSRALLVSVLRAFDRITPAWTRSKTHR